MKNERVNLKSTLAKKVTLQSNTKNIEIINKQISEIHNKGGVEIVRSTIHLPRDIHTKIKMYCVANAVSFKDYVTDILIENFNVD